MGALIAALELVRSSLLHADQRLIDFRVFWCGGRAALDAASPYLFEPLHSCEHRYGAGLFDVSPNFVMPFVLPPFDVPPFELLARMPYEFAAWFFTITNAVALIAGIALVAASTRTPVVLAAAGLLVSVGLPSLVLGQIVPLELLFLSACAFALIRGKDGITGLLSVFTLLEPHVGAFVLISVALLVPRARLALGSGLALLAYASVWAGNVAPAGLYAAALAGQVRAEAGAYGQYSLTYLLRYFHAPMDVAITLGALSSVVLVIAAVLLSRALDRHGVRAAVVYVPAACAVIGGTFIHLTQIALAVPAALLLYRYAQVPLARRLSGLAVVVLAIPWPLAASNKQTLACALVALAVTVWHVTGGTYRRAALVVALTWIALMTLENSPKPAPPIPQVTVAAASALAGDAWKDALDQMASDAPRFMLEKVPTWLGLLATLAAAFVVARSGRRDVRRH